MPLESIKILPNLDVDMCMFSVPMKHYLERFPVRSIVAAAGLGDEGGDTTRLVID